MSSRLRDKRRARTRYTGVLRSGEERDSSTQNIEHSEPRNRTQVQWRLFSFGIVVILGLILGIMFLSDAFYVRSVAVSGITYLTKEEIFAFADIANMHIFWIESDEVRENLLLSPSIADADVTLSWPPNMVNIFVQEREPALVWEQAGTAIWVDVQGKIMAQRQDRPDLIRVNANLPLEEGPLGTNQRVEPEIVIGALQLQELLPDVDVLRYDPVRGLGYRNANGWDIWFGSGIGMAEKVRIFQELSNSILAQGIQPGEINIVNPDAPYYTVLWGR